MPKLKLNNYYRVVVTGDRNWPDNGWFAIKERMTSIADDALCAPEYVLIITGGARGVDTQADLCASILSYKTHVVHAEWDKYGKKAGPIRNIRMLEQYKPHLVLAFHNDLENSKGTKHCVNQARAREIEVEVVSML